MKFATLPSFAAAALLSLLAVLPFLPEARNCPDCFAFEVSLASTNNGKVQVYWDDGTGMRESTSSIVRVPAGPKCHLYRLALPTGALRQIRFDPLDRDGTVTLESARIVGPDGRTVIDYGPEGFRPGHQIESMRMVDGRMVIVMTPGGDDPQLLPVKNTPFILTGPTPPLFQTVVKPAACVFAVLAALLWIFDRSSRLRAPGAWVIAFLRSRPALAIGVVSAVAVIASAYPVVFLGKSYASPLMEDVKLLYTWNPTLPGMALSNPVSSHGSDVGALMWQHAPLSTVERRSVFRDGAWPLWNRYNSCGIPLFGQGQSMFGDPLHLVVLAANGAAWAWDLKFLLAKWLFASAIGALALAFTRRVSVALLASFSAAFIGFFVYRISHPAFFSFCYAPWPLYFWVRTAQAGRLRSAGAWAIAIGAANVALMCSGTAKEAYMLLVTMNLSGLAVLCSTPMRAGNLAARLGLVAWTGLLTVLVTAPDWMTFLDTLHNAYTSYNVPAAYQLEPSLLLGAFDEVFYRTLMPGSWVLDPSLNFLFLGGLLYFLATLRFQVGNRPALALAASSLLPLSLAFGLVPSAWIVQVPFLGNIVHLDNTFSCPLLILWSVVAAVGFSTALDRIGKPEGRGDLAVAGLLLFALVFHFVAFGQVEHKSIYGVPVVTVVHGGAPVPLAPFIWEYLGALLAGLVALALTLHWARVRGGFSPASVLIAASCVGVLLWRFGQQAEAAGFTDYVVRPAKRVDLLAPSEAVSFAKDATRSEPSRCFGLDSNLFPGWNDVYGLETISGPDALMCPDYRELITASPIQKEWDWRIELSHGDIGRARRMLDFLNVGYYFDLPRNAQPLGAGLILKRSADLDVYWSPTVWPRAFFTDRVDTYGAAAELAAKIDGGDGRPFAAVQAEDRFALSRLEDVKRGLADRTVTPASGYRLEENETSFDAKATGPGLLVLEEILYKGYPQAELNGVRVPVLRINHAFLGVPVPEAGTYHLVVRYRPHAFVAGLWTAGIGLFLLALTLTCLRRLP